MDIANLMVKIYLSENFIQTAFVAIVFATAVGHLFDRAMGEKSFGVSLNAVIILFAKAIASSIDDSRVAALMPDNALRISMVASAIGSGILIMTLSLRRWLQEHI